MLGYTIKRILQVIPVLLIISFICFMMIRLVPGDPVANMLGVNASKEAIAAQRAELGLDKPLLTQYGDFLVKALQAVWSVALIAVLILTSVDLNCFSRPFYADQYRQLNTAQTIGMSEEDLDLTTDVLLDYTQGKRGNLDVQAVIGGQVQEVFNQREKDHMVDVQALYLNAMSVRNLAAAIVIVGLGLLVMKKDKALRRQTAKMFLKTSAVLMGLAGALAFYAFLDFNEFWTMFHHIFFRNDLWLLDPNTDVLIMMVPETFFFNLVFRILGGFGLGYLVCLVLAWFESKGGVQA